MSHQMTVLILEGMSEQGEGRLRSAIAREGSLRVEVSASIEEVLEDMSELGVTGVAAVIFPTEPTRHIMSRVRARIPAVRLVIFYSSPEEVEKRGGVLNGTDVGIMRLSWRMFDEYTADFRHFLMRRVSMARRYREEMAKQEQGSPDG